MFCLLEKKNLNRLYSDYPELTEFDDKIFLYENDKYLYLPRRFKSNYECDYVHALNDDEFKLEPLDNIRFFGNLKPEQNDLMNEILPSYYENGNINGIIKARPGFGKTVCAAYLTSVLKLKTLIILDNSKLVEQWLDSYLKFTNLTEDDIGMVVGKKFNPKPVTITMVQTLLSKTKTDINEFYQKLKQAGFGLVFYDEMHKSSSTSQFGKSSLFINTPNIIGLTATPYGDSLHKFFMKNIFGEQLCDFGEYKVKPIFNFIKYRSAILPKNKSKILYGSDYIRQIGMYNKFILTSVNYTNVITRLVQDNLAKGLKTIIIVTTIAQLKYVQNKLEKHSIKVRPLYRKEQYVDKENDDVIVAVYRFASHGFDNDQLNSLILATPLKGKTSIIQTIGRVLRPKSNITPVIYDLIDIDFGNFFLDAMEVKKNIIRNEFNVDEINEITV